MIIAKEAAEKALKEKIVRIREKLKKKSTSERMRTYVLKVELPQIEAALARVKEGTYGLCTTCDEAIEPDRLKAIPEVLTCKVCDKKATMRKAVMR